MVSAQSSLFLFSSFDFSRTSSSLLRKKLATSASDIPRRSVSFKKNKSALSHGWPLSAKLGGVPSLAAEYDFLGRAISCSCRR
jgi:hypothetical protein